MAGRNSMRPRQASIPRIGTTGTKGVRKGRRWPGLVRRKIIIAPQTKVKANRVPMFVRFAASPIGTSAARMETAIPVIIVAWCGVPNLGWTLESHGHNSPSRDMA